MNSRMFAMLGLAAVAFSSVGCADPCGDLKTACEECSDEATKNNCIAGAELADALGADDACQQALDEDNVCGEN